MAAPMGREPGNGATSAAAFCAAAGIHLFVDRVDHNQDRLGRYGFGVTLCRRPSGAVLAGAGAGGAGGREAVGDAAVPSRDAVGASAERELEYQYRSARQPRVDTVFKAVMLDCLAVEGKDSFAEWWVAPRYLSQATSADRDRYEYLRGVRVRTRFFLGDLYEDALHIQDL